MDHIESLDQGAFAATIAGSEVPVLADFRTARCAPCRAVAPVLEEIAAAVDRAIARAA